MYDPNAASYDPNAAFFAAQQQMAQGMVMPGMPGYPMQQPGMPAAMAQAAAQPVMAQPVMAAPAAAPAPSPAPAPAPAPAPEADEKSEPKSEPAPEPAPAPEPEPPRVPTPPPATMEKLVTRVPAEEVSDEFKGLSSDWPSWDSSSHEPKPEVENKFHFVYDGDYDSERCIVISGRATITADDGSVTVEVGPGDSVHCHQGFAATWEVHEPLEQRYGYFGEDGKEIKEVDLTCDICGVDCFEESYLYNDEMDICPACFRADEKGAEEYEGAMYQREGEKAAPPEKKKKRASTGGEGTGSEKKKRKSKKDKEAEEGKEEGKAEAAAAED